MGSNLGWYQTMVVAAKAVGGPEKLFFAVAGGGFLVLRGLEAGGKKAVKVHKAARDRRSPPCPTKGLLFTVTEDGADSGAKLALLSGDSFRVLECDEDAILIEVIGNPINPYMVSGQFLATVSAFPTRATAPGA